MSIPLKSVSDLALSKNADENAKRWADSVHYLECAGRMLALDEDARTVKHIISTGALDRSNRIVDPSGWRLAKYRENPVVLANHDYTLENIIGRASDTRIEGNALVSTTEFASEGLGNVAFRLVQAGLAKAWSVGWIGIKAHRIGAQEGCVQCESVGRKVDYGTHYTQQELLEYSLVAIPANPDAVMGLQRAGLASADEVQAWLASFPAKKSQTKKSAADGRTEAELAARAERDAEQAETAAEADEAEAAAAAAAAADPDPASENAEDIEIPKRSKAFYDAVFTVSRAVQRRSAALNAAHSLARR